MNAPGTSGGRAGWRSGSSSATTTRCSARGWPRRGRRALQHDDFALVDHLWRFWSPGLDDREHIAQVKRESLSTPGATEAVLGYYRALLALGSEAPEQVFGPYPVPTLAIWGGNDLPGKLAEGEEAFYSAGYRREIVGGAGHFVHREAPGQVSQLIVDWLTAGAASSLAPT